MRLNELKTEFHNGEISKNEYIDKMYDIHKLLFDYAGFIGNTDISRIEISDGAVVLTTRESSVKLVCDSRDKRAAPVEILNFDQYESKEFQMVIKMLDEDSCILDIGANIGWYSLNIARLVKNVEIYSFEPVPVTFDYLKRNVALNAMANIHLYNFGFSNEDKELVFFYSPEGSGNSSLVNLSGSDEVEKVHCKVKRLDDFVIENNLVVDFIKCDVEGAELFVFQGGLKTIETQKPVIFTEMLRKWSQKFGYHPNDIISLMEANGYGCFVSDNGILREFYEMDDETAETNFFFLHKVKHQGIISKLGKI